MNTGRNCSFDCKEGTASPRPQSLILRFNHVLLGLSVHPSVYLLVCLSEDLRALSVPIKLIG